MGRLIDHPRVALVVGLVLGGTGFIAQQFNAWGAAWVCWGAAALVVLWSAATAEPVRRRTQSVVAGLPFTVQVAWRGNLKAPRIAADKGFLDFEKSYLKATEDATKTLNAFAAEMNRQNPKLVAQTARTQTTQGASVETRLRVANETAQLIDRHAARFERLEKTYRAQCEGMSTNLVDMLSTAPASGGLGEFPNILAKAQEQTTTSRESMVSYREAVKQTRKMRVSQPLNQACDRLIAVLDRVVEDTDSNIKALADARTIISNRWPTPPSSAPSTSSTAGSQP